VFVEHSADGVHGFEGRFREVTPPERVVNTSLFHTREERDGMLSSGMEQGLNQSYAALDRLLATLA
jgi:uncharacterized protein YndB with AHSA1/START domain